MSTTNFSTLGSTSLLAHASDGWEGSSAGKAITLTYAFMPALPTAGEGNAGSGFSAASASYVLAVQQILAQISSLTLITFKAVSDTPSTHAQLDFGANAETSTLGVSYAPTDPLQAGQIWLDTSLQNNLTPGTQGFQVLLAQIAHALGLSAPLSSASPASQAAPLASQWNNNDYTVLATSQAPNGLWQSAYAPLDVQALQALYGINPTSTTSSLSSQTFKMTDASGQSIQTLPSTGLGLNTLDCSSLSRGVYINLNANTYSSIGIDASGISSLENVFIGPNTKLQKVIGTNDDDVMLGNSLNDVFVPNAGNDVIKGGTGLNTVVLSKSMSQYSVGYDLPSTSWLISDNDGVSGTKTLSSVARIQFSDLNLALDLSATQAGGETAEILGAILGPAALKNPGFVGFGLNALDNGTTMNTLMQEALNYELGNNYSAAQEIALLYQNVLGTPAQSSDISYWSNFISTGKYTQTSLAIMAAQSSLNTNNINLSGLSQSGLTYTPYNLF